MAASIIDGPQFTYGNMAAVLASVFGMAVGDPNTDAGPSADYQGRAFVDPRYYFGKDQVTGYAGKVPSHYAMAQARSVNQIPAAVSVSNIAAAAFATSGTAMTLVAANATGITINVPYIPFSQGGINQLAPSVVTPPTALMLDFGFAFCTCTSGNTSVTVSDSSLFTVGMPLVIAGAGNAGGTIPLLTTVASITDTTHIVLNNAPLASPNPAAIGTGNIWGPSETFTSLANMTPTAASPWIAAGPGLFLDPRQAIARGIQIVGAASGTGGNFAVVGLDIYNNVIRETIAVGAGAVTGWGKKAFKGIISITPAFTDAHNYSVGTSDVFGLHYRAPTWEDLEVSWNAIGMGTTTGYTAPLALTTTATATTADVRGTIQTSASGGGTGIGATASNGTVSGLAMTGVRLLLQQSIPIYEITAANPANFTALFGQTQF